LTYNITSHIVISNTQTSAFAIGGHACTRAFQTMQNTKKRIWSRRRLFMTWGNAFETFTKWVWRNLGRENRQNFSQLDL